MAEPPSQLCALCREFTDDLVRFDFTSQDTYPSERWYKDKHTWTSAWGDTFRHHDGLHSLAASAPTCHLCRLIHDEFLPDGPEDCMGEVLFHPFHGKSNGELTVRFADSVKMKTRAAPWVDQPHSLIFCPRRSYDPSLSVGDDGFYRTPELQKMGWAIPRDGAAEDVFETARWWLKNCVDSHDPCVRGQGSLPKRVLDVGAGETCRLYLSRIDEIQPYAVLTHCWGGPISLTTTTATLQDRVAGIELSSMPKNFRDAIIITRELGLRYIWIDALCIIQDDAADWEDQASKMAAIYSDAHITLSALDASSSDVGILKSDRDVPEVVVDETYTLRRKLRPLNKVFASCPLNARGWCLQEKLLSLALLHFGSEQIFWECRLLSAPESSPIIDSSLYFSAPDDLQRSFLHSKISAPGHPDTWKLWYQAVERFSSRNLTVETDKFPALAGVAARFGIFNQGGTYVAGLWAEDIARGVIWSAAWKHYIPGGRKAAGYNRCDVFTRASEQRAPSWSWAALNGGVTFFAVARARELLFSVVDIQMSEGSNDPMARKVTGKLRVRGQFIRAFYRPPEMKRRQYGDNVGSLALSEDGKNVFTGAVVDFMRMKGRKCWAMLLYNDSFTGFILLKERGDEFVRIGFCEHTSHYELDISLFKEKTITWI